MRIREGDSLEIYTDKDGEVIFKKYSPMGELSAFAAQMCETLSKTTGAATAVCDRDSIIAASGNQRREIIDKRISEDLERIMEGRQVFHHKQGEQNIPLCEGVNCHAEIAAPIISEGDVSGCVLFISGDGEPAMGDTEYKLAQTVAGFLGRQMEA
jgi:AbrB family transcriptional regulator (stage V sporulation protein T)